MADHCHMQLSGNHTFNAPPSVMWALLMDENVLARLVPGISRLERTGENTFASTLAIKLGPVSGSFNGSLELEELKEPESFVLKVQQKSSLGNAASAINIKLSPVNEQQTEMEFNGVVKLSGLLASMGQRVVGGVSGTLTKQFFSNLESELEKKQSAST